jgi:hypothetical protein
MRRYLIRKESRERIIKQDAKKHEEAQKYYAKILSEGKRQTYLLKIFSICIVSIIFLMCVCIYKYVY